MAVNVYLALETKTKHCFTQYSLIKALFVLIRFYLGSIDTACLWCGRTSSHGYVLPLCKK